MSEAITKVLGCELGCKEECKAKMHGCASECPALSGSKAALSQPAPLAGEVTDETFDRIVGKAIDTTDQQSQYGRHHFGWFIEFARAILALRPQAVPMTEADTVQVYGMKNGQQTLIGTAPMPLRMKARELAREQFGHFEDGDESAAELCFCALEQLIEHMERSAHHGITAKAEGAA